MDSLGSVALRELHAESDGSSGQGSPTEPIVREQVEKLVKGLPAGRSTSLAIAGAVLDLGPELSLRDALVLLAEMTQRLPREAVCGAVVLVLEHGQELNETV